MLIHGCLRTDGPRGTHFSSYCPQLQSSLEGPHVHVWGPLNPYNTSIAVLCTLKPRNAHTLDLMQPVLGRPDPGTPVSSSQCRLWKEDQLLIRRFQVQACVMCSRRRREGSLDGHNLLGLWTPYTIERTSYIIWRIKYKMKMQDPLFKQK